MIKISSQLIVVFFFLFSISVNLYAIQNTKHQTTEITIYDKDENELIIDVYPAQGKFIQIWLIEHVEQRLMFEHLIDDIVNSGIEVWRINLINNYFLPESSASIEKLSGHGVSALINHAIKTTDKKIIVSAYDRMSIVALKGIRHWQSSVESTDLHNYQLLGSILYYPNLFQFQKVAGLAPDIEPIINYTNLPVIIYQPENGAHIHRINDTLEAFWNAGSSAFSYIVPGVRDWFFMHALENENRELRATKEEKDVTALIPDQTNRLLEILDSVPKQYQVKPMTLKAADIPEPIIGLKEFPKDIDTVSMDLDFKLFDLKSEADYKHASSKVTIVNFWATWCPPCVEEIPSLNRLLKHTESKYNKNLFNFVSIDFQEPRSDVEKFMKNIPINFPVLLDTKGIVSNQWNVFALPSSFIIDKNGKIRYSINRGIDWNTDEIKKIIDDLINE